MTDNEIIKALRFCSDQDTCSDDCSFYVEGETVHECTTKLSVAALALIKRQQERMDRIVEKLEEKKTKFSLPKHCKSIGVCPPDKTCSECIVEKFVEDIIAIVKGVQNE